MTDYPDWQTPGANATQIAAAGVPLLAKATVLLSLAGQAVAGGGAYNSPVLSVGQIGYEWVLNLASTGAATSPFASVALLWSDSSSGAFVDSEVFFAPVSTAATVLQLAGSGPSRADQLTVQVRNLDPAVGLTMNLTLLANSRVYSRVDQHWVNSNSGNALVTGFSLPLLPADSTVLGTLSGQAVAAGATGIWMIGNGAGRPAVLTMDTGATALANVFTNLYPLPALLYGGSPVLIPSAPAALDFSAMFITPHAPMALHVVNNSAAAISVSWTVLQQG